MQTRSISSSARVQSSPRRDERSKLSAAFGRAPVAPFLMLSILFLASIQVGGVVTVALQIAAGGLLASYLALARPREFLGLFKWWPLLLLPIFAIVSTNWSLDEQVTLRYSTQFLITAIIGVLLARSSTPRTYVALLYVACAAACVIGLATGREGPAEEGMVPIGLTGSKNEFAYSAQLLLTSSIAVLMDRGQPIFLRLSTLFFICVSMMILAMGQAAGALLTAVGSIGVLGALFLLHRFKLGGRLVIIGALIVMIPPVFVAREEIIEKTEIFMQDVLKKDTTLTGRTYLWERADDLIRERPVIGHGYRAILVGETVEGQGILRWAKKRDGRAFHFHSTYRDLAVDLGFVGAGLFALTMAGALLALIRKVVFHPTPAYSFFLATFLVVLAKSPGELVVGQFVVTGSMLFSLWVWAFAKPEADASWQGRSFHADGQQLYNKSERRVVVEPIRLAAPIRTKP